MRQIALLAALLAATGCTPRPPATKPSPPVRNVIEPLPPVSVTQPSVMPGEHVVYLPATAPADPVVAVVAGREIRLSRLRDPLIEGYGLSTLLNIIQLELARAEVEKRGLTVTPEDVDAEAGLTLAQMFPDTDKAEYPRLLEQVLQNQRLNRTEFRTVMTINAHLRKVARQDLEKGPGVDDKTLLEAFNVFYGENIQVRHIALSNLQEVGEAKKRLDAGTDFATVARDMSRNPRTAALGGELPAFARQATDVPENFKEAAFALKDGEVSDPVQAEGYYQLIKCERHIAPKVAKFDDVKESLRKTLVDRATDAAIKQLRTQLGQVATSTLDIREPILSAQWKTKLEEARTRKPAAQTPAPVAPPPVTPPPR